MCGGSPKTILTDEQKAIRAALSDLKQSNRFTGVHLLDWYHILKNIKKVSGRAHLQNYKWLVKAKSEQ
jgi:hypothetical protein